MQARCPMMKKVICLILAVGLVVAALMCAGCQANPEQNVVISKNDGAFDANKVQSADETHSPDDTMDVSYTADFSSTDGSVDFHIGIADTLADLDMPVVQFSPYFLTASDAKRVAYTLFQDAVFYEAEPEREMNLSRSEIQEKIQRWSQYTNVAALKTLYGDLFSEQALENTAQIVKKFIEQYTELYEDAPEENPHTLCQWTMRKASEYQLPAEERVGANFDDDNDEVSAQFTVDGIPYYYCASTRNKNDFKVNMIYCCIYGGMGPDNLDSRYLMAKLCRTGEPDQAQIDAVIARAEQILRDMELGEWYIDEWEVTCERYGEYQEYAICINAVPVINGVPAIRQPQLGSLRDEDGYAPNQYMTDVNFKFSADGHLLSFALYTPLETEVVVNDNAKVMGMEELLERAQELLTLTDRYEYGYGMLLDYANENVKCSVNISRVEYGMVRVKVPDSDDGYYYVPAITLKGAAEYIGVETGKVYYQDDSDNTLLTINAIDGTVVNTTNS